MNKSFCCEKKGKRNWVLIRQMPHDPQYKLGSHIPSWGKVVEVREEPRPADSAEVFLHAGEWCVRYTSGPRRAEMIRLFGQAELPTPFTVLTPVCEVLEELRRLNPGATFVEVA